MKRNKKLLIILSISIWACNHKMTTGAAASTDETYNADGKEITVYTTAENTDLRLSRTDTLKFKDFGQPVETQICIFVDPT